MSYLTERRLEEKERRRIEILDAAEAVASIVGIEAMTMDQVAKKARLYWKRGSAPRPQVARWASIRSRPADAVTLPSPPSSPCVSRR